MAETKQGSFPATYHHIEAPTKEDKELGKLYKKRVLKVPEPPFMEDFRHPLYYYLYHNEWIVRRKLDGQNLRVYWNGEQALWNGKSDAFTCGTSLVEYMNSTFLEEIFEENFGREKEVWLFGEHMGPKVQGNELNLTKDTFVLFDVKVNDTWLSKENVCGIAEYFGIPTCYDFMPEAPTASLCKIIAEVSEGKYKDWEGVVAVPTVEIRDQQNHRIIVKVKNKDYYEARANYEKYHGKATD